VPSLSDHGIVGSDQPVLIHDTAIGQLVEVGNSSDTVSLYVCGITPYDATHLGHAATYLLFDELQRVLADAGKHVRYVQNVTDVDDPLLERATATGVEWTELAEREIELFRTDMTALRILAPAEYIGAVEAIPDIVSAVAGLRSRGAAYDVDGDLYFAVDAASEFGSVGHLSREEMIDLSRERGGDPDRSGKKDPVDCLLWQAARPGEPAWDSELGRGRPGWHIECCAIALKHLGATIDVQGGGDDLVFPHHEMSAAEATVLTGAPTFARAYLHQAMVGYQGEKMSKSRGNLVLVSALRQAGVDPMAIRLALLGHAHDTAWEWHDEEMAAATERLGAWRQAFARPSGPAAGPLIDALRTALRGGLRTPGAVAVVDEWVDATGDDPSSPLVARIAVDALLGIV
jgi:L-cysteine:1D-myo-inositol 2-amino-2-deoxy-alpha-D-glucopyranoside ligase